MNQVALQHSRVESPVEKSPVAAVARAAKAAPNTCRGVYAPLAPARMIGSR